MKNHNDNTCEELSALFFAMKQLIRQRLPDKSLEPNAWSRFETMRYIARERELSMHDVAKYLRISAPSATSLISNLVREKLVARRAERRDKRVTRVSLTAKGRRALALHDRRSAKALREVFSKLDAEETTELVRILRRLQDRHRTR